MKTIKKRLASQLFSAAFFLFSLLLTVTSKANQHAAFVVITHPVQSEPALGVAIPKLEFADDVRAYIKSVLAAPIPSNYVLPTDISSQKEYEKAVAIISVHFPEFKELEGDDLLRAVKKNPLKYQALILEAKSVREMFFPGSQPKATK